MNSLNGKLDQESITKSIDLREKLTEETNKLDSLKAEEGSIGLKEDILTQKHKIEELKLTSDLHDLTAKHEVAMKEIPDEADIQIEQDHADMLKVVNESDSKLQEHARAQLSTRKQVAEALLQSQAAEEASLQAWLQQ